MTFTGRVYDADRAHPAANNHAMSEAEDIRGGEVEARASVRWRAPGDDFFRPLLALPELAVVAESCADERLLHERLVEAPTRPVDAAELAALVDDDARANYAVFLAFRDAVVAAGSLESYYLGLIRAGAI